MNSHNTKTSFVFHKTPATGLAEKRGAEVLSSSLIGDSELAIAGDVDNGCDPYNTTGQHVVLPKKFPRRD